MPRNFGTCPRCGGHTKPAIAINGGESEFWRECQKCNTYINTYVPQPHQRSVHTDSHVFVGNFGGYGSGKTLTSREELYKHIFLTPGGNTLIGANVASQYEQTIKRDIEADLPAAFVKYYSTQKQYYDFINDHRLIFRPFDDPDKLRSYNISMFIMVEASEICEESFTQLKTRLRNTAACLQAHDKDGNPVFKKTVTGDQIPVFEASWLKGIVESNPDSGWIRSDMLEMASEIHQYGTAMQTYRVREDLKDPAISVHVTSTDVNEYLPENFITNMTKNKPAWWVARYLNGSFLYSEGLVYPSATQHVVKSFDIPPTWKRIVAYDYGLSDDSVFLFGAIDEKKNLVYIYKEVVVNNKNIEELATIFKQHTKDIPIGGWVCSPIIDPKSAPKRDYDKRTLADHFADYGIIFKPGFVSVDARVFRLNTYFESGKLKIMEDCPYLIEELKDYKFKPIRGSTTGRSDKPEDKNNHAINCLEWITMELPADPQNLVHGIYNKMGMNIAEQQKPRNDAWDFYKLLTSDDSSTQTDNPFVF